MAYQQYGVCALLLWGAVVSFHHGDQKGAGMAVWIAILHWRICALEAAKRAKAA